MAQHRATVTVAAPAADVYQLFSHFNDYPKFMTYVREVTYLDAERSHWVVDMLGAHEWDAVNEGWIAGERIGWRSTSGLTNAGSVTFTAQPGGSTVVSVEVRYEPPGGPLGAIAETVVAGAEFERRLQHDLDHFAAMVHAAPPGALDPTSSAYLFHARSAAATGRTTAAQDQTMGIGELIPPTTLLDTPTTTSVTSDQPDLRRE